jgi:hypothetical protein
LKAGSSELSGTAIELHIRDIPDTGAAFQMLTPLYIPPSSFQANPFCDW